MVIFHLEMQRKTKEKNKRKKEERREKKLDHGRIATVIDFYIVLQSFFVRSSFILHSSSGQVFVFKDLSMIHRPLGVLSIVLCIFIFVSYHR